MSDGSAAAADVFLKKDAFKNRSFAVALWDGVHVASAAVPSGHRSDQSVDAVIKSVSSICRLDSISCKLLLKVKT